MRGPRSMSVATSSLGTGRTVTRLLRDNGFEVTVVDLNVVTVRELREQGVDRIVLCGMGGSSLAPEVI